MVKSNKKTINPSRSVKQTINNSKFSSGGTKTRTELIKILNKFGIKVPASLSLKSLRELVAHNHDSSSAFNFNDNITTSTAHHLPGSYPSFDIESDIGDH